MPCTSWRSPANSSTKTKTSAKWSGFGGNCGDVEMRYGPTIHYNIPYPRPFYKTQGSTQESGVSYLPYLDSAYDRPVSPHTVYISEGSGNCGLAGGFDSAAYDDGENTGAADQEGREGVLAHNPVSRIE